MTEETNPSLYFIDSERELWMLNKSKNIYERVMDIWKMNKSSKMKNFIWSFSLDVFAKHYFLNLVNEGEIYRVVMFLKGDYFGAISEDIWNIFIDNNGYILYIEHILDENKNSKEIRDNIHNSNSIDKNYRIIAIKSLFGEKHTNTTESCIAKRYDYDDILEEDFLEEDFLEEESIEEESLES